MALTDHNEPNTVLVSGNDQAREPLPAGDGKKGPGPATLKALARLPQIYSETSETADLAGFLRAAVGAAAALMLMGAVAVSGLPQVEDMRLAALAVETFLAGGL